MTIIQVHFDAFLLISTFLEFVGSSEIILWSINVPLLVYGLLNLSIIYRFS